MAVKKYVHFRADKLTQLLVEQLVKVGAAKDKTDVYRKAVYQLALVQLSDEELDSLVKIVAMDDRL